MLFNEGRLNNITIGCTYYTLPVWTTFLYFIFSCCQVRLVPVGLHLCAQTHIWNIIVEKVEHFFFLQLILTHWLGQQFSAMRALALLLLPQYCFFLEIYAYFLHMRSLIFPAPPGRSRRIEAFSHLLPWWIMLSVCHWWGLFISSCTGFTQGYLDSELIELSVITCSETENSEFDSSELVNLELRF